MAIKTEGRHAGAFLYSEANKTRSRAVVTIQHGEVLKAGAVLSHNSVTGKYAGYDNDGTAQRATVAAILFDNVNATAGDVKAVAIVRDAEVNGEELIFADTEDTGDRTAAEADLKAVGIICRWASKVT